MKRILSVILAAGTAIACLAQTEVSPYHPGVTPEGITYFLPRTTLRVVLRVTCTQFTPGEYARYADRFLRLKDVTLEPREEWAITSATIETFGQADPTRAYTIRLNPKSAAPLVGLADDGRLLSVNAAAPAITEPTQATGPTPVGPTMTLDPADFKTQEILAAGSTLKMAELAAAEIFDIRENRGLLAKGQADFMPKDGEQLRLMMEGLDKQEQGLLSLFVGTKRTDERTLVVDYVPTAEVTDHLLFRFSRHYGLVDADDLSGRPYYLRIKDLHSLPTVETDPAAAAKNRKTEAEDLRYCVPGKAQVTLYDDSGQALYAVNAMLSQLGRIEHLGGDLFNKRFTTHVLLSPVTGGIQRIDGEPAK